MDPKVVAGIERGLRNALLKFYGEEALIRFFRGRQNVGQIFSWDELDKPDSKPIADFIRITEEKVES